MVDAAVGYQCPSCVAEGRKATRSGRAAYGGLRSGNPGLTSSVLIGINAAVWLAVLATGASASRLVDLLALRPNGACVIGNVVAATSEATCGGTWFPGVDDGAYWQLMTSAFLHVEIWHIGFNMLALWFLGPQLEQAIGRTRFVALYLISALAGSALVYWASPEFQPTLGASGAIFGLMGGLMVVAFKVHGDVRGILVWIGINAVFTFTIPNVSWQGHLGGFLGGAVAAAIIVYAPRTRRTLWQSLGLGSLTLGIVVAIVARTAVLT
jgi:membrane associated rhomboid family serine protease